MGLEPLFQISMGWESSKIKLETSDQLVLLDIDPNVVISCWKNRKFGPKIRQKCEILTSSGHHVTISARILGLIQKLPVIDRFVIDRLITGYLLVIYLPSSRRVCDRLIPCHVIVWIQLFSSK